MKFGDKDGYNSIYDSNGELILHPKEKVLISEDNVVPSLKSTWRYYGGEYLLEPSKGSIYLTNERLIFINIPERMFAIGGEDEMRAMSAPMESSFELGDMTPGGTMREYFEIPNIEIMGSEKKEGAVSVGMMVNMYVLSSGNQFHLSMVLNSDSELLSRLMNKKVNDLDELVNNLKDFFQKTDWMYTEPEKKLYHDQIIEEKEAAQQSNNQGASIPADEVISNSKTVVRPNPVKVKKTEPKVKAPDKPREKLKSNSMKYFQNLYNKGLITEEIYGRLVSQYGAPGSSSSVNKKSEPLPVPKPIQPEPEALPVAETLEPQTPPQSQEQADTEVPKEEENANMKDEDLLGIISDTIADVESAQKKPDEGVKVEPAPVKKVRAKKRKTLTIKD